LGKGEGGGGKERRLEDEDVESEEYLKRQYKLFRKGGKKGALHVRSQRSRKGIEILSRYCGSLEVAEGRGKDLQPLLNKKKATFISKKICYLEKRKEVHQRGRIEGMGGKRRKRLFKMKSRSNSRSRKERKKERPWMSKS